MAESKDTYKKGLRGIAVFGGLQVYKILLSVLTTKVSALFLGPAGSGVYGLISSTLSTVESFTSCGLGTSAVKDISQAAAVGSQDAISRTYTVLNRLVWITGFLGLMIVAVFSSYWSSLAFGNTDYTIWFVIASVTMLLNQLTTGQGALLTGLQKYKLITKLRLWAGVLSAVVVILSYFLWGVNGILPVIIGTALINFAISTWMSSKCGIKKIPINIKATIRLGKPMFVMGVSLGVSWALSNLAGYLVRIYISHVSDVAMVGLFTASFSIVNTYLGLVFSSIESDYFPRLSKTIGSQAEYNTTMRQEIELLLLLIIPLVGGMVLFSQPVLAIFYSTKFYAAKSIICWTAFSMIFKVPSWAMSVGLIARGQTKRYLVNQVLFIIYQMILNLLGFKYYGLTGLGISYVVSQIIFTIQNFLVQRKIQQFRFSVSSLLILSGCLLFGVPFCVFCTEVTGIWLYAVGAPVIVVIGGVCVYNVNRRTGIVGAIKSKLYGEKGN